VLKNYKYVMKITGDDDEGKRELDNFINPEETYPVIATTSKLMTTGIDAQTCKLIVLDSNINSMTEFKQIIGRGTRINEEFNKTFFTIMDFRNVTDLFADPAFDGEPVMVKVVAAESELTDADIHPEEDQELIDPATGEVVVFGPDEYAETPAHQPVIIGGGEIVADKQSKVYVAGVDVSILNVRVQHLDGSGKLITESLRDYTRRGLLKEFLNLDEFLARWNKTDKKAALIAELEAHDIILENLRDEVKKDFDLFDMICHIAWDMPALTRRERADQVKKRNYFTKYGEKARLVLNALLEKYASEGIENIEDMRVLTLDPIKQIGTPDEIVNKVFGGKQKYLAALKELETEIYRMAA
jgi:type I restriction enzyme R subunit